MFARRRRSPATTSTDLPFCVMCDQHIRVDTVTGRCALGHRVVTAAATTPAPAPVLPAADESTAPGLALGGYVDERLASFGPSAGDDAPWDSAATQTQQLGVIDDFLAWDAEEIEGPSALDVDTDQLPVTTPVAPDAASRATTPAESLLDELDDAAHARRRAVGTIGATIAVTGAVFGAVAVLPVF